MLRTKNIIALVILLTCMGVLAQAGPLTPLPGQGLVLLGANADTDNSDNSVLVFDYAGNYNGTFAASAPGHGLAYGDINGDGNPELLVGTGESSDPDKRGAYVWSINAAGDTVSYIGSSITNKLGNGVAIGNAGSGKLFVGSQNADTDSGKGAFIFDENNAFKGSVVTNISGGGVAFGNNIRGNGKPGLVIGTQGNATYGASYFEYDATAGWQYGGSLATFSGTGAGTAVGDTDGDGFMNVLVVGGSKVYDFQWNGSTFAYRGEMFCGDNIVVKAVAFGSVSSAGAREVLVEVDKNGLLEGFLFRNTGVGAYTVVKYYTTFMPASGSTGAAIVNAKSVAANFPKPSPGRGLILLGANEGPGSNNNSAWVFDHELKWRGVFATSRPGHGLAYGDADNDSIPELVIGTNDAATVGGQKGAFIWKMNSIGDLTGTVNYAITYQDGDGVAVGKAGTDAVFVGNQYSANTGFRGAVKYNASVVYAGELATGFTGGGVAYGTNIRGNNKPGLVIGSQGNGTYGATYFEYDATAGWQYAGSLATFRGTGSGTAVGDIDGDGIPNVLVGGGDSALDFQWNGSGFAYRGSLVCGTGDVKAIAVGSVTHIGAREILIEVANQGMLEGFLFKCNSQGSYTWLGSCWTGMPADGSTGAAIIDASSVLPAPLKVGAIKNVSDNTPVAVNSAIVSGAYTNFFYVQDGANGIRVEKTNHGFSKGQKLDVAGLVKTNSNDERFIYDPYITTQGTGTVTPLGVANKAVGGGNFASSNGGGQVGVNNGVGLNNIGLLVKVWGKYEYVDDSTFLVDDGSGMKIKCSIPNTVYLEHWWSDGGYVAVTGICTCQKIGGVVNPLVLIREAGDFTSF